MVLEVQQDSVEARHIRTSTSNWIKNKFLVSAYVLKAEMDIKIYKIGQTIPNTYPGGFKLDLLSSKYHKSLAVSDDERPPSSNANITKGNTEYLLFKNKLSNDILNILNQYAEKSLSLIKNNNNNNNIKCQITVEVLDLSDSYSKIII